VRDILALGGVSRQQYIEVSGGSLVSISGCCFESVGATCLVVDQLAAATTDPLDGRAVVPAAFSCCFQGAETVPTLVF
jgi:hypothetical protein